MKKFISLFIALIFTFSTFSSCFASVLGSSFIDGYTFEIGKGTTFTKEIVLSDQNGVGKQTENYIVYKPSTDVEPIISYGTQLYGTKKISDEIFRLSNIYNLAGGINADFFSLQTGVPMGNLISDGKIITKDSAEQDTIAITKDGKAFITRAAISSIMTKEDGTEVNIHNINKYRQPYSAYLLTKEFSKETHNSTLGVDVILGSIEGEMKLGGKIEAVVEEIFECEQSILIPDGKMVLTIDKNAPEEFLAPIASLAVGEKVQISFDAIGEDTRLNSAKLLMGSVGGRLLTDGEVNQALEKGAAPRTAIGIKKDGSLIFYTIDGRQPGHSYGVQLKTLAERLKELGCTDAINLDGGGSTSISALLPGEGVPSLLNKPSDGRERGVSTFFFLKNNLNPTGKLGNLTIYPFSAYLLTGATIDFSVKASDTNFHPLSAPKSVTFSVETDDAESEITSNGKFTAKDSGKIRIKAKSGSISTYRDVVCLDTPTDIVVKSKDNKEVSSLNIKSGEKITLSAEAFGGYNKLITADDSFIWKTDGDIGEISSDGVFTAVESINASGEILVTAGKTTKAIPVNVTFTPDETDKNNYPEIIITETTEENQFVAELKTPNKIPVDKEKIIVKADGEEIDFEFDEENEAILFTCPDETSKISIYATNISDLSSFKSFVLEKEQTDPVFEDAKGHWAENVLTSMHKVGIINGEDTHLGLLFRPQKQMTRSEFAVMICNYLGLDLEKFEDVALPFEDADEIPTWAIPHTKALLKLEIAKGKTTEENTLICQPNSPITRAEAATIISRTIDKKIFINNLSSTDKEDIPFWAEDGIKTLVSLGAMNGYSDGSILPLGLLTKAEAAKLLYSIL